MLSEYIVSNTDDETVAGFLGQAIERTTKQLFDEIRFAKAKREGFAHRSRLNARAARISAELSSDGVAVRRIPAPLWAQIRRAAEPFMEQLREKAAANPQGRNVVNLKRKMWLWYLLERAFGAEQFVEGLSEYMSVPMMFAGGSIEYSHPGQTWWRGCYDDVGLEQARTTYMHFDHAHDAPKAMVMLCDVGELNGATSFVPGSHVWRRSEFCCRLHHELDYIYAEAIDAGKIKPHRSG